MTKDVILDGKTILLVEDEVLAVERVTQQLCAIGIKRVIHTTTVDQALDALCDAEIDLALLDVNLQGDETTIELGRLLSTEHVPLVFYSGFNPESMARATRGHEFMEKPLSTPRLKAALQRAILRQPRFAAQTDKAKKMAGHEARQ